jgi:hypothetical protein
MLFAWGPNLLIQIIEQNMSDLALSNRSGMVASLTNRDTRDINSELAAGGADLDQHYCLQQAENVSRNNNPFIRKCYSSP